MDYGMTINSTFREVWGCESGRLVVEKSFMGNPREPLLGECLRTLLEHDEDKDFWMWFYCAYTDMLSSDEYALLLLCCLVERWEVFDGMGEHAIYSNP